MGEIDKALHALAARQRVLAVDLYQQRRKSDDRVIYLTAGTNTLLKIIHRFHIREVPGYFMIKKQNDEGLYKQDSKIYLLEVQ
jgi:N-acetylmuramic acid 6-phosphate (MurNAc-6-P) etherase